MQLRTSILLIAALTLLVACQSTPKKTESNDSKVEAPPTEGASSTPEDPIEAAARETEGDESLVGLIGTYRIEGALRGKVYAFSEEEIAGFMGEEISVTPSSLATPWLSCDGATWTQGSTSPYDAWITEVRSESVMADESRLLESLAASKDQGIVTWTSPCDTVEAYLSQMVSSGTLAMSWDGVTFIARTTR